MEKIRMKLKIFAEWFVEWFVFITVGILIICAINFSLFSDGGDIPMATLWRIILSALLTAAVTAVFFLIEPVKKSGMILWFILHFCCLTGIMILCGIRFGWIDFVSFDMIKMTVSVAVVYVFATLFYYIVDKHRAKQMNRRLREKYKDDERIEF